jgi:predicted DNA-binding transcriptional regulator AlpA
MYLTTREAAALLGVSVKGLAAMRARGAGPKYVRIGNRVRYVASELPKPR